MAAFKTIRPQNPDAQPKGVTVQLFSENPEEGQPPITINRKCRFVFCVGIGDMQAEGAEAEVFWHSTLGDVTTMELIGFIRHLRDTVVPEHIQSLHELGIPPDLIEGFLQPQRRPDSTPNGEVPNGV